MRMLYSGAGGVRVIGEEDPDYSITSCFFFSDGTNIPNGGDLFSVGSELSVCSGDHGFGANGRDVDTALENNLQVNKVNEN